MHVKINYSLTDNTKQPQEQASCTIRVFGNYFRNKKPKKNDLFLKIVYKLDIQKKFHFHFILEPWLDQKSQKIL